MNIQTQFLFVSASLTSVACSDGLGEVANVAQESALTPSCCADLTPKSAYRAGELGADSVPGDRTHSQGKYWSEL